MTETTYTFLLVAAIAAALCYLDNLRVARLAAVALLLFQIPFVVNFFWSMLKGRKATSNPWEANTLEWTADSPPPHGNCKELPTVYRGPYEYSVPGEDEDFIPQFQPPVTAPESPSVPEPAAS